MSNKELLPCPFCNGKARKEFNNCKMEYEVFCSCCDAFVSDESEIRAEEKWNARNYSEKQDSLKEMPLVPKWVSHYSGGESLDVSISQYKKLRFRIYDTDGSSNFKYHCDCTVINFIADKDSCIFEEVGEFYTLEEAKAKANECIRELGERLLYFADKIRTNEDTES